MFLRPVGFHRAGPGRGEIAKEALEDTELRLHVPVQTNADIEFWLDDNLIPLTLVSGVDSTDNEFVDQLAEYSISLHVPNWGAVANPNTLDVWQPAPTGAFVRKTNLLADPRLLAADLTSICH